MKEKYCLTCQKVLTNPRSKYCSNSCLLLYQRNEYIRKWKNNEVNGLRGSNQISKHIISYLFEKYNNCCQECGWSKTNIYTNLIPLLVHHVDGDCTNNSEENLLLLCPNCHVLTDNFGSRNTNCTRVDNRKRY